jgi:hypothetical protein
MAARGRISTKAEQSAERTCAIQRAQRDGGVVVPAKRHGAVVKLCTHLWFDRDVLDLPRLVEQPTLDVLLNCVPR